MPAYHAPLAHSIRYRNQGRAADGMGALSARRPPQACVAVAPGLESGAADRIVVASPACRPPLRGFPMRMDKLTSRFQQALADAQSLAVGRDHNLLEPVHVLVALLEQSGGSTRPLLAQAGVNVPLLRERLGETLEKLPKVSGQPGNLSIGNDLGRLLNLTDRLAQQNGDQYIASEWFVVAALEDTGAVGQALKAAGADKTRLQAAIDKVRGG